ncbi:MAG TPA: hypothetical protein VGO68_20990 [Pyrinomonadaceae bacterium]|nr:hypothetical protein [Pyrinomonadaceae bacterium]
MNQRTSFKTVAAMICFLLCISAAALGQARIDGLPKGALVIETRKVPSTKQTNRTLVLWMLNPQKVPSDYGSESPIPCPSQTRGSYYSGPTRVSLLDSGSHTVINTVKISEASYKDDEVGKGDDDTFDVPYAIRRGYYYHVAARARRTVEAKPTIMWLRDYNGDGKALEFALFDAPACMGLQTTLIGYSEKQDRVIHYPVKLEVIEGSKQSHRNLFWADYLFTKKPERLRYWQYEVDYTGRGGTLDSWEVRYNPAKEQFEGKVIIKPGE